MTILEDIVERKLRSKKRSIKSLFNALGQTGISQMAEIKRASPSKGKMAEIADPAAVARLYVERGARAISVLSDEAFEGSLEDLRQVSEALAHTDIPILQKDIIVSPVQLLEALQYGADAVLLMVSVLKDRTREFLQLCNFLGLEALVEVHTEEELAIAIEAGAKIIGVNQRNLHDFSMHPELFGALIEKIPEECVAVAASGIALSDLTTIHELGFDAVLMGEALSRRL